ncbi:helix-turn-helix domain-containing protein [Chitinophaga oryziterrae]|uniref:Helix-turn-helix domain-containing protein n=1 Tax=Chitinophaga oryziterrae TaxID=1031224 RepID=A0A6N8J892_9BACT|nr:helix-turn-helix domain-containing protein [Chitinophaga oryziterrae]MVT40506.1 helix-turn-helix domain-containing protein [Chitinophaga oryziterrae]
MATKKPFIISYGMEDISSSGIPFVFIEQIGTGDNEIDDPGTNPHRHGYYALGICATGESCHMFDFERIVFQAQEMALILPGQVHQAMPGYTATGWLIAFTAEFLAGHPVHLPLAPPDKVKLSDADFAEVKTIAGLMKKQEAERGPHFVSILQNYLSVLLTLLQRNTCDRAEKPGPALLFRYRELLATHFLEWTKPAQYAAALHISADHLNEVVKQHTGQTASSLITDRRILEAKRLLLHARESVKEIAWHLQFNEISYFNRFFKQHTGHTPASFREAVREKYLSIPE